MLALSVPSSAMARTMSHTVLTSGSRSSAQRSAIMASRSGRTPPAATLEL